MVDRVELRNGDASGRVLYGLLRNMDIDNWFVREVFAPDEATVEIADVIPGAEITILREQA